MNASRKTDDCAVDPGVEEASDDRYAWLRRREDPRVERHLEEENGRVNAAFAPGTHAGLLREQIHQELMDVAARDDASVPQRHGPFVYFRWQGAKLAHPLYLRRPVPAESGASRDGLGAEELVLDANAVARRWPAAAVVAIAVSPDHRHLIYGVDRGDERRLLIHRPLPIVSPEEHRVSTDRILAEDAGQTVAWAGDSRHFFYTELDASCRPCRVLRRRIDHPDEAPAVVFEEHDQAFRLGVRQSRSGDRILIESRSLSSSEILILDATRPESRPLALRLRRPGVREAVAHHPGALRGRPCFFVLTEAGHSDFEVLCISDPLDAQSGGLPEEAFIPPRAGRCLESLDVFAHHLVMLSRSAGRRQLHVVEFGAQSPPDLQACAVSFPDDLAHLELLENPEFDPAEIRVGFTSLTTPYTVYDVELATGHRRLRKRGSAPDGFIPRRYRSRRLWAKSADGTRIPITVVERPDRRDPDGGPLVLNVYGAYGVSLEPIFDPDRLSLLDRGIAFALAHVRGGGELGEAWHEAGRGLARRRGIEDLIACRDALVEEGVAHGGRIALTAESAGGFLAGAAISQTPERFRAAALDVPFVDARATLSNPQAPLSVIDRDEWGDPRTTEGDALLRALSPCDNIVNGRRPALYVTVSFLDSRVAYWEGARWVEQLRDIDRIRESSGEPLAPLLLRTTFTGGHWGDANRFVRLRQKAERFAFLIDQLLGDHQD